MNQFSFLALSVDEQDQYTWTLHPDDLRLHANTTIDGFWTVSSHQFHPEGLDRPVV